MASSISPYSSLSSGLKEVKTKFDPLNLPGELKIPYLECGFQ